LSRRPHAEGYHLRTGAECNTGACHAYFGALVQMLLGYATLSLPGKSMDDRVAANKRKQGCRVAATKKRLTHAWLCAGVQESEVESLAGKKEGCEDEYEFVHVQRPANPPKVGHPSWSWCSGACTLALHLTRNLTETLTPTQSWVTCAGAGAAAWLPA